MMVGATLKGFLWGFAEGLNSLRTSCLSEELILSEASCWPGAQVVDLTTKCYSGSVLGMFWGSFAGALLSWAGRYWVSFHSPSGAVIRGCGYFSSSGFVLHCTDFEGSEQGSDGSMKWLEEEAKVIHSPPAALFWFLQLVQSRQSSHN